MTSPLPLGTALPGLRPGSTATSPPTLLPSPPISILPPSSPSIPQDPSLSSIIFPSFPAPVTLQAATATIPGPATPGLPLPLPRTTVSSSSSTSTSVPRRKRSGSFSKPVTPRSGTTLAAPASSGRKASGSEMKRSKPTFTTCRSYPENAPTPVVLEPGAELQRNQRRSKVQAISKIDRAVTPLTAAGAGPSGTSFLPSKGGSTAGDSVPGPSRNPLHRPTVINPPFKMEEVRTSAPRYPESRAGSRLFGLPECPIYYPTAEEFTDPLAYIAALPTSAKDAGICKIVPPEGWRMPFSLESDTFRFKTRLQRLNSLEAASRAKINFLEQLTMFHLQQGDRRVTIPIIDKKPLDLWRIRKEVTKMGGYEEVTAAKAWARVSEMMGHEVGWAGEIQLAYKRIVHPFDTLSNRAKSTSVSPLTPLPASKGQKPPGWVTQTPGSPSRSERMAGRMSGMKAKRSQSPPPPLSTLPLRPDTGAEVGSPQTPNLGSSSKIRIPGFSSKETDSDLSDESLTPPPPDRRVPKGDQYQKGEVCEVCLKGNCGDKILLCDGCDRGFHIFCLEPPLSAVPTHEEWFCPSCLFSQGDDYGFEEGEDHSVASFSARDAAFSGAWWSKHRPSSSSLRSRSESASPTTSRHTMPDPLSRTFGRVVVSEDDVEREFWRLTESNSDTVEVEYGADVHSTTHGSAAPTLETHPLDPYAKDGWNLNNMPILPDSLLRYIKSDISGMTVPWIYIGMMFSAFCWHNEDHYTYSVNYMYWGETKTWYGIPGADAEAFESAIKAEAPDLFAQQPSLLYQLVTMMNPGRLAQSGVKVLACDQRPNEFVVTFPKAYHCGFNHGINFNEAVNFALPDWLPEGRESVMTYKKHAKPPVFSHNELLISITLYSDTIKTALWVKDSLQQMVAAETARRDAIRKDIPHLTEILSEEDCPEEQYQCYICKGFSYLSQITCSCTKHVTCIEHADLLCRCAKAKRVMRKRYSEAQLEEIVAVIMARAAIPGLWEDKFQQVMLVPRPALKSLRGLLADGEKIAYPLPELEDLRAMVVRANGWVEKVTSLGTRKTAGRRRKGQQHVEEEENRSPEYLAALLVEAERMAFDAPEVHQLRQMLHSIHSFQSEADFILSATEQDLDYDRCKTALILGQGLQVDLPEISKVEKVVNRLEWFRKVGDEVDDRTIQYEDVLALLAEAKEYGIPESEQLVSELKEREGRGKAWKTRTEALLASKSIDLTDVNALIDGQELTPTSLDTMLQLETLRKTALNWQSSAQALLSGNGTITAASRLCRSVKQAQGPVGKVNIPEISDLQAELDFHAEWLDQLAGLLTTPSGNVAKQLNWLAMEVRSHLDPTDDEPNDTHACFCRNPATATMVACETCNGSYHPKCLNLPARPASLLVQCTMCSRNAYDDRPSLHRLAMLTDTSKWNFIIPPGELALLRNILEKAVDFSRLVIPLLAPYTDSSPPPDTALVIHFARKLFTIPIAFDAVHSKTNQRVIFEDWLFKRMREARQPPSTTTNPTGAKKANRPRRPRLILAESKEKEFQCICKTPPTDHLLQVRCGRCDQGYHLSCVMAPLDCAGPPGPTGTEKRIWRCPCCAVKEGKFYLKGVEVRVQETAHEGTNIFIDYRSTVVSFVDQPIYVRLPVAHCILLHCIEFVPAVKPEKPEEGAWPKPNGNTGEALGDKEDEGRPKKKARVITTMNWRPVPGVQEVRYETVLPDRPPAVNGTGGPTQSYRPTDVYRPPAPATNAVITPRPPPPAVQQQQQQRPAIQSWTPTSTFNRSPLLPHPHLPLTTTPQTHTPFTTNPQSASVPASTTPQTATAPAATPITAAQPSSSWRPPARVPTDTPPVPAAALASGTTISHPLSAPARPRSPLTLGGNAVIPISIFSTRPTDSFIANRPNGAMANGNT